MPVSSSYAAVPETSPSSTPTIWKFNEMPRPLYAPNGPHKENLECVDLTQDTDDENIHNDLVVIDSVSCDPSEDVISDLEAMYDDMTQRIKNCIASLEPKDKDVAAPEVGVHDLHEDVIEDLDSMYDSMTHRIRDLIASLRDEDNTSADDQGDVQQRISRKADRSPADLATTKETTDQEKVKQYEVLDLQTQLATANSEAGASRTQLDDANITIAKIQAEHEKATATTTKLSEEKQAARVDLAGANATIDTYAKEIKRLKEEVQKLRSEAILPRASLLTSDNVVSIIEELDNENARLRMQKMVLENANAGKKKQREPNYHLQMETVALLKENRRLQQQVDDARKADV